MKGKVEKTARFLFKMAIKKKKSFDALTEGSQKQWFFIAENYLRNKNKIIKYLEEIWKQ